MPRKSCKKFRVIERHDDNPDTLTGKDWAQLIAMDSSYAAGCCWGKLNGDDWARLLSKHPEYAYRCDWGKLNFDNWNSILKRHSEFVEHISFDQWLALISEFPEYVACYKLELINQVQWGKVYDARAGFLICLGTGSNGVSGAEMTDAEWQALYGIRRHLRLIAARGFKRANTTSARHRERDGYEKNLWEWYAHRRMSKCGD